jgi:hypothetical protein
MPAPLIILASWTGRHLAAEVGSEAWKRIKALAVGDPQVKAIAEVLYQSISATVDAAAEEGSKVYLREGVFNAFAEYTLYSETSDADTVLAELRYSIDCTLRESGLNSLVPNESITQLQFLAPGISLEFLVNLITQSFVMNIKKKATKVGSPLRNLSDQLNADEIREATQQLSDKTRSVADKLDAILELNRNLLFIASQENQNEDLVRTQVRAVYDTLKLVHRDYLLAFAEAEKLLQEGIGSTDLIYFFEARRAALAADRIEAIAQAEQMLSGKVDGETNALSAFAQAISAYFEVSNGPTRITYFTSLLTYIRDQLQLAKDKQWKGAVRIDSFFFTTADAGKALLNALASARVDLQRRFEDVAHEYTVLDS